MGSDGEAHGESSPGGRSHGVVRGDPPSVGDEVDEGVHQLGGVDALPSAVGRQQADAHVDPTVAEREDPAIARDDVALRVADVEVRFDVVVGRGGGLVVAPDGHAHRPLAPTLGAECPTDSRVGPIGHDHDPAAQLAGRAGGLVLHHETGG